VVGQPIDHRRGHLVVGENRTPFRKLEVRGDDETPPFIAVGYDPEQEMRALLIDRHVTLKTSILLYRPPLSFLG